VSEEADRFATVEVRASEKDAGPGRVPGDPARLAEGWTARYLADERQVQDAQELYGSLGFEVLVEAVPPEALGPRCSACSDVVCTSYRMIYTRRVSREDP
jgi:hypothetical protein